MEKLANQEGFPKWENAEFVNIEKELKKINSNSVNPIALSSSNNKDSLVLIPLVLVDKKNVNSFIACKLDSIITFQLYERDNYSKYGYQVVKNKPNANDITRKFMMMDYSVFGYTRFGIIDSSLIFYKPKPKKGFVYYSLSSKDNHSTKNFGIGDACVEEAWFYDDGNGNVTQVSNWEDVGGPCLFGPIPWIDPFSGIATGSNWGNPSFSGGGGSGGGQPININGYYYSQIDKLQSEIATNPFAPIPCQYL